MTPADRVIPALGLGAAGLVILLTHHGVFGTVLALLLLASAVTALLRSSTRSDGRGDSDR